MFFSIEIKLKNYIIRLLPLWSVIIWCGPSRGGVEEVDSNGGNDRVGERVSNVGIVVECMGWFYDVHFESCVSSSSYALFSNSDFF